MNVQHTVTIVLSDQADGGLDIQVEFDPPVTKDTEQTMATASALHAIKAIKAFAGEQA